MSSLIVCVIKPCSKILPRYVENLFEREIRKREGRAVAELSDGSELIQRMGSNCQKRYTESKSYEGAMVALCDDSGGSTEELWSLLKGRKNHKMGSELSAELFFLLGFLEGNHGNPPLFLLKSSEKLPKSRRIFIGKPCGKFGDKCDQFFYSSIIIFPMNKR
jgi:hypothetical protein